MSVKRTAIAAVVKMLVILPVACGPLSVTPQSEHYMLRSEFYRAVEDNNRRHEAEKELLRERIANLRADLAREEGKRIQVENEWQRLGNQASELKGRIATVTAEAEEAARAARVEIEGLSVGVERMEKELASAQELIKRYKFEEGRSVLLLDDIEFASASSTLTNAMKKKIKAKSGELRDAANLSIIGYTDDLEMRRPNQSNWGLAAARSAAVADYLARDLGIVEPEITPVARGPQEPKVPNVDSKSRQRNRRVEIIAIYR